MLRHIDAATSDLDIGRIFITLDDKFRSLVELACILFYVFGGGVLPTCKFFWFRGSSLMEQRKKRATNFPTKV